MKERVFKNKITSIAGLIVAVAGTGLLITFFVLGKIDGEKFTVGMTGLSGLAGLLLLSKDKPNG